MDIETFFTAPIAPPAGKIPAGKNGNAPVMIQGLEFIDMILSRMLQNVESARQPLQTAQKPLETKLIPPEEHTVLSSGNPALAKKPGLDPTVLLADSPEITEEVRRLLLANPGLEAQIVQTLQLNQKACEEVLNPQNPLLGGLVNADANLVITDSAVSEAAEKHQRILQALLIDTEKDRKGVLNSLQMILNKLEKLTQEPGDAGLTLTNLTPEKITNLREKIQKLLASGTDATDPQKHDNDEEEIAGIVLGLIKILPPQARPEIIVLPQALVITPRALDVKTAPQPSSGMFAQPPANDVSSAMNGLIQANTGIPESFAASGESLFEGGEEDFENLLKEFAGKKPELDLVANKQPQSPAPGVKPDLSALTNWPFTADGSIFASGDFMSTMENLGLQTPGANLTGPGNAASLLTQASSAGTPHPATQMIAATLQKAASDGANKNFTLQLDPPELGRIDVRLSFGKDKAIKAVVLTERPETLAMLQRDAHSLERALHNVGLDANGSLSFELASDGHFNHDGGHDGSGAGGGTQTQDDADIIESTMTWYVDPDTGQTRYDIFV